MTKLIKEQARTLFNAKDNPMTELYFANMFSNYNLSIDIIS